MNNLRSKLRDTLELHDPGLIGCRRRNIWTQEDEEPWRRVRGNALLYVVGNKEAIDTPVGPVQCFMLHQRWLLQFRGGPWNNYWLEDFFDLWSLARVHGTFPDLSDNIIVLQENQGELTIKHVPVDDSVDPKARTDHILENYRAEPPGRIRKDTARALRVCQHCPVKLKCDATDKRRGEDHDWSPNYPEP